MLLKTPRKAAARRIEELYVECAEDRLDPAASWAVLHLMYDSVDHCYDAIERTHKERWITVESVGDLLRLAGKAGVALDDADIGGGFATWPALLRFKAVQRAIDGPFDYAWLGDGGSDGWHRQMNLHAYVNEIVRAQRRRSS